VPDTMHTNVDDDDPKPTQLPAEEKPVRSLSGSEVPGQVTIPSENAGTLVIDLPDLSELPTRDDEVNAAPPAPEQPVAMQPGETPEEAGERINAGSEPEAKKPAAKKK